MKNAEKRQRRQGEGEGPMAHLVCEDTNELVCNAPMQSASEIRAQTLSQTIMVQ
jgi:hypothetical protein